MEEKEVKRIKKEVKKVFTISFIIVLLFFILLINLNYDK